MDNFSSCGTCQAPLEQGAPFCGNCGQPTPQQAAPVRSKAPLIAGVTAGLVALGGGGWFAYDQLSADPAATAASAPASPLAATKLSPSSSTASTGTPTATSAPTVTVTEQAKPDPTVTVLKETIIKETQAAAPAPAQAQAPAAPAQGPSQGQWQTYSNPDWGFAFTYPPGWTVSEVDLQESATKPNTMKYANANIYDSTGALVANLGSVRFPYMDGGGAAPPDGFFYRALEAEEVPQLPSMASRGKATPSSDFPTPMPVKFATRIFEGMGPQQGKLVMTIGLSDLQLGPVGAEKVDYRHPFENLVKDPDISDPRYYWFRATPTMTAYAAESFTPPSLTFTTEDEAKAFLQTEKYQNLKKMIMSLQKLPIS